MNHGYRLPYSSHVIVERPVYVQQPQIVQQPVIIQQAAPVPQPVIMNVPTVVSDNVPVSKFEAPSPSAMQAFTINIPHQRGGYFPVVIKKTANGFLGPQGEFYSEFPKVEQLKIMYGN